MPVPVPVPMPVPLPMPMPMPMPVPLPMPVIVVVIVIVVIVAVIVCHYAPARFISVAAYAAPNPLSMFTTVTPDAQLFNIESSAAIPPKLAP